MLIRNEALILAQVLAYSAGTQRWLRVDGSGGNLQSVATSVSIRPGTRITVRAAANIAAGRKWFGPVVFRATATGNIATRTTNRHDNENSLTGMLEPRMLEPWLEPESR